jgi:hypothetical protein
VQVSIPFVVAGICAGAAARADSQDHVTPAGSSTTASPAMQAAR